MKTVGTHRIRSTRMARIFFAFITSCVVIVVTLILTNYVPSSVVLVRVPIRILTKISSFQNYLLDVKNLKNIGLVVNTTNCQIPDFSAYDPTVVQIIDKMHPIDNCNQNRTWSNIDGNDLLINRRRIRKDGYLLFKEISCCYKLIIRVEQPIKTYTGDADNEISYSECIPILKLRTKISKEFIVVECSEIPKEEGNPFKYKQLFKSNTTLKVLYRGYHAIPQPHRLFKTDEKIRHWIKHHSSSDELPPNILLIGIDSTSRLNFRRHMFKTRHTLQNLGAIEMMGYTKTGENTFPNFCAFNFGYSEEDLGRICYYGRSTKLDDCPSIFKRLDQAKYITALTEDSPVYTAFNYLKTGFVRQPVDFYPRPLFLSSRRISGQTYCVGNQVSDEVILSHVESVFKVGEKYQTPVFSLSWSTTVSHDDFNGIQLTDATYAGLIERLESNGHLNNTILIFMGDHGYRWGDIRKTLVGYYEDKLPNMWIRLPSHIKEKYPQWLDALKQNSGRLTSPFTLFWTINLILDTFTNSPSPVDAVDNKTKAIMPRRHRQNFFEPVAESNTCVDVGVPEEYCACFPIQEVDLKNEILIQAANASILNINNNRISPKCIPIELDRITAGAFINKTMKNVQKFRYIVGFTTLPGEFVFEAEVNYFPQNKTFSTDVDVSRVSKIDKNFVKCINDSKLELFCYCKS